VPAKRERRRRLLAYERRSEPLLPRAEFTARLLDHGVWALAVVLLGLAIGTGGYHWLARLPWLDALLNAAMILSGMGPVDPLPNAGAKLFATVYALLSGVLFVGVTGLVLAPVLHRILHRLHLDEPER
jgi:hypothetical protein